MRQTYRLMTLIIGFIFTVLAAISGLGQTVRNTEFKADKTLRSNARVNPSTLGMELSIPISGYQGRGGSGLPVSFDYSSKLWQMSPTQSWWTPAGTPVTDVRATYAKKTAAGWTSNLGSPRIDDKFDIYTGNYQDAPFEGQIWSQSNNPNYDPPQTLELFYIKRLNVQMEDGSTHEFRQSDARNLCGTNMNGGCTSYNFDGTYYSVDGSKMRLEVSSSASTLYLPDGSRYLFAGALGAIANTFVDHNGNTLTYNASNRQWTDTMGRVVSDPMPFNTGTTQNQTVGDVAATFPGFNGGTISATFSWRYLKDPNGGESGLNNVNQDLAFLSNIHCSGNQNPAVNGPYLFQRYVVDVRPCSGTNAAQDQRHNPVVLTKITLPNGATYQFKYNIYGEIEKIIYPTGAYERFNYSQIPNLQASNVSYDQVNRGVTNRWVSVKGDGTDEVEYTYAVSKGTWSNPTPYKVTITNPDGTRSEQLLFDEIDDNVPQPYGYGNVKSGRPYEERVYSATNQLMKRTLTLYTETAGVTGENNNIPANRDVRPSKQISIIFEPGTSSALATMSETVYDSNGDAAYFASLNPKQQKSYNFVSLSASTAQTANFDTIAAMFGSGELANISETDYLYDANYKARNLVTLPIETRVKNAAGAVQSASQIFYDEGSYPILSSGSTVGWNDPNTNVRGNPTTARSWLNTNNSWIETHVQYDNFGNVRKSWDARGNVSEVEYSSNYYFAYPTKTKSAVPDPSGQTGSSSLFETNTTYDPVTGLPLTVTDANGQTSSMQYNDPLLRPTKVIPPTGGAVTETIYNDTPGNIWVKTRTQVDGTNWKEAIAFADGLGRAIKTQSIDNQGDVFSETVYDNMGRVKQVTNPFRNGETKLWTTTNFDAAGRPFQVVTPDNAVVQTNYDLSGSGLLGTVTTVTDQAGKQRRSITNGLGQLVRVDEPNDAGSLGSLGSPNQPTFYTYDTLNNLVQVNQGVQQRNFTYNSLSRLLSATNPESGTINYAYDPSGNLTQKTDARGVVTNYVYDNLNRVVSRTYNDATPAVTYKYDNLQFGKGKLIQVSSAISTTNYAQFDNLGRVLASQQVTDGQTYNFGYAYNLSGALTAQTYPSGRVVTNQYETDGDLAQVNGSFDGQGKTYVSHLSYTSAGAVSSLQLGNQRWENTVFNSRLQPIQIGLGTAQNAQDLWKVNYEYGELQANGTVDQSKNNGNVGKQTITVPAQFTAVQTYSYDSLNRLKTAEETVSNAQTWKQTFTFDRYGNRKFDPNQTTTLGNCPANVCNPDINPANNRVTTHTFDNSGNTTVDAEGRQFFYDGENKQKEVKNAQGQTIGQYLYDGDGKRIKKIAPNVESTIFVYDAGGRLASEYTVSASQQQAPQTSYLTNDTLGSPRITTDQAGAVGSRRDFRPYGEEISRPNQGTDKVRQKFTSYERDNETDLDFAKARMYQNKLGRFTSTDPLLTSGKPTSPQTWNRFAYVRNNPLNLVDPTGLCDAPTGLKQGQVGICFEAFIAQPRLGPGGVGHGDGRGFDGNNPNLTARVSVSSIISTDTEKVKATKKEQIAASVVGGDDATLSGDMTGPDGSSYRVDTGIATNVAMQGTATTDVKLSNINSKVGENDFGAGVDVTVSIANGTNGGQQLGKDMQTKGMVIGGPPGGLVVAAGKVVEAFSPAGTIDGNMTVRITGNGQVTLVGGESRGFPSYAGYAYTVGADGKVVTTTLVERKENKIEDLTKPMTPFPR